MALNREQKEAVIDEVANVASSAFSAVAAEYRGLSVSEMTQLRSEARNNGVYLKVVKNSLARRAIEGTDFECLMDGLSGPLVLAFSKEDPGAAGRVIKEFAKDHENLKVTMLAIGGKQLDATQLDILASMPTYDQAISMLMSVMQAPVTKLAQTLNEVPGKLVRTVVSIKDSKDAA